MKKQKHDEHDEQDEKKRMTILVDMDNTIVDYSKSIASRLSEIYPNSNVTADNWQMLELNDLHFNRRNIQSEPKFFRNMSPIPGALEALKEMEKDFHVLIVSSPSIAGNTCHSEKCEWVKEHLGERWARNLVLTKDKTIVMGDILIDDKPYITGSVKTPIWTHVTFGQPYNINLTDTEDRIYIHDWSNWNSVINKIVSK